MTRHTYSTHLVWDGSPGAGYREYPRAHGAAAAPASAGVTLSADPSFRGDAELLNPEQLLVMAASCCQLLSFLAVAARKHIDVVHYDDDAQGFVYMSDPPLRVQLTTSAPVVQVAPGTDHEFVRSVAEEAHRGRYIASGLNSTITMDVTVNEA